MVNQLSKTLEATQNSTDPIGSFPAFLVGNNHIINSVQYVFLRNMSYFPNDKTLAFIGDGYQYIIQGKNMRHLLQLFNGRMISSIIEGDSFKMDGEDVEITSVIISSLTEETDE